MVIKEGYWSCHDTIHASCNVFLCHVKIQFMNHIVCFAGNGLYFLIQHNLI
jgi:hypothetical protein